MAAYVLDTDGKGMKMQTTTQGDFTGGIWERIWCEMWSGKRQGVFVYESVMQHEKCMKVVNMVRCANRMSACGEEQRLFTTGKVLFVHIHTSINSL